MGNNETAKLPIDTAPSEGRQAELEAAYRANVAGGKPPYEGVAIKTRGELTWILSKRHWSANFITYPGEDRPNLSGAVMGGIILSNTPLWSVNLSGARLWHAKLSSAEFCSANLSGTDLSAADLSGADLRRTDLTGADLTAANLSRAHLGGCRLDAATQLFGTRLDPGTRVIDVVWNDAPLARVAWGRASVLGDETDADAGRHIAINGKYSDLEDRSNGYADAARGYQQLAIALRNQGVNEIADKFAYRAQVMQRKAFRWRKEWGDFLFSWFLFLVCGYGYRLWRILATYAAVIGFFSIIYWMLGIHSFPHETSIQALWDSFLVSLSAIHGRTTFEQLGAWSPAAWAAAVESVLGIVVEGVFVAMLIQRLFTR